MNEASVSVSQVFAKGHEIIGKQVSIQGELIVSSISAYLIETGSQPESSAEKIIILQDGFLEHCLSNIPCWVGGPYCYYDLAQIEGTVISSNISDFQLGLSSLKTLTIFRDEDESVYSIDF
ncbi:MAG TPA: hypothetical protein VK203_22385 [Nostocaceae cyanobacterium]|nr:hypothetical protein [Nostocaceae cyanobacterium]